MRTRYLIGIEFEYLLTSKNDYSADGLRFYNNIAVKDLSTVLENRPGAGDPTLYHDSEGVKNGYWYVEGVERYTREGKLLDQAVKGLEVRTPPTTSIGAALNQLLRLEHQLRVRLMRTGLDLAVAAYHPTAPPYVFDPPLAAWEEARRLILPECRLADVAMLTYGPDLNFSLPDWSETQLVAAAEKLAWFAPYISLFTLNAPFAEGNAWGGLSRRTSVRGNRRPACFAFVAEPKDHPLLRPHARVPNVAGSNTRRSTRLRAHTCSAPAVPSFSACFSIKRCHSAASLSRRASTTASLSILSVTAV
ncbi:hypothetical protein EVAR_90121_1 [Eumeta japonica]|uniref:Glutamate--cysteine ligase n=1 Tax=Eumeta variegata TaxID=151549 RepID=A0A4C2A3J8_EUMVA|nr:hypothetical protein EVAR_90121_1 [Eumeta japonica]